MTFPIGNHSSIPLSKRKMGKTGESFIDGGDELVGYG